MKIGAKFAFVDFVDFFVDFFSKTGKKPQMDFSGALDLCEKQQGREAREKRRQAQARRVGVALERI